MSSYILNEDICPLLSSESLKKLSESKVNSINDLLLCDLSRIRSISRNKQIEFNTLLETKYRLYRRFGPKKSIGSELAFNGAGFKTGIQKYIITNIQSIDSISYLIQRLDELLVNGIRRGEVSEVYGYSGSGKTQFCYSFAINLVKKYEKKVLFIDTDMSFSLTRLREIVRLSSSPKGDNNAMESIKMITILDICSLLNTIETISHDMKTNSESQFKDLGLIIIDCLSTPLSTELKKITFEAEIQEKDRCNSIKASELRFRYISQISQIGSALNCFASDHSIAVVVVNTQSLSLKNNWKNYCKLCLNFCVSKNEQKNGNPIVGYNEFKTIKITRTYDKSIQNTSYEKFRITPRGFVC